MNAWRVSAILLRCLYFALIAVDLYQSRWLHLSLNALVFFVLLGLAYFERKDAKYYAVDTLLLALFIAAWASPLVGVKLVSSVFGPDKLFHFSGGLLLGWLAMLFYRDHISDRAVCWLTAVLAALAVGAAWEVVEYVYFVIEPSTMLITLQDSMLDLVADTLGACVGAAAVLFWKVKK